VVQETLWLQLFGGGGSGFDLPALIAFIAFAVIYLITPVVGYREQRPAGMAAALYLLIGYGGLSLVQLLAQWPKLGVPGRGEGAIHLLFVFTVLKLGAFLAALIAFVTGLRSLRLRDPGHPAGHVVAAGLPPEERFRKP
jgi:hypothetical protein